LTRIAVKQNGERIVGARLWRGFLWILVFSWATFSPAARADDASAPTNSSSLKPVTGSLIRPLLSTNSASTTYLQNHPELAQATSGDQPALALRPDMGSTNAAPEMVPPGSGVFPETLRESNPMADSEDLAAHLLVVYNENDPDSQGLARYYASKRNIPAERVFAISAPITEEITRAQYNDTVRSPIVSYLCQKDWMARESQQVKVGERDFDLLIATRNDIWAIVLMRGVPLKIAPDPSKEDSMEYQPSLQTNAAAVDNELALLPVYGLPEGGFVPNLFFDDQVSGIKRVGPELSRSMVLVTRLDGPTVADVRRMIDDTLYAEQNRLAGLAVIDTRGLTDVKDGYTSGDNWLRSARDLLDKDGWDIRFDDKPDVLPATEPCNQVALYLGWYHDTAMGPWVTAPDRFVRGAIAYHLHSFSAATVRSETSNWVGPLIAHGAAATMGMVYEPYLPLTPHEDIFTRRLLQGDYFAEAAYASERALSWMLTVVGDPLYRPFRQSLDSALTEVAPPNIAHYDWLLLQKVQREINAGQIENTAASLRLALQVPGASPVVEEGLGNMLQKLSDPAAGPAVAEAYRKALDGETVPIDRIRVGLKLAQYYSNHNQDARAQAQLDDLRERYPEDSKRFGVSDAMVPTSAAPESKQGSSEPRQKPSDPPRLPSLPKPTPVPQ
jgi:uncharacterized protein (TIGR03790 family)